MLFKFKKQTVTLNAFVSEEHEYVLKYSPLKPAQRMWPEWWKNLEQEKFDFTRGHAELNMRSCSGIINTFNHGFFLPLWTDLAVTVRGDNFGYVASDQQTKVIQHFNQQAPGLLDTHLFLKLESPWAFEAPQGVNFVYQHPFWNQPIPEYLAPYGIIEYYYQHGTGVFFIVKRETVDLFLHLHQPLVHYVPLTDKKLLINQEVLSKREFLKYKTSAVTTSFTKKYKNQRRILEGRCPIKTLFK